MTLAEYAAQQPPGVCIIVNDFGEFSVCKQGIGGTLFKGTLEQCRTALKDEGYVRRNGQWVKK